MTNQLNQKEVFDEFLETLSKSKGSSLQDYLTIFQFLKGFGNGFADPINCMGLTKEELNQFNKSLEDIPKELKDFVYKTIEIIDERYEELGELSSSGEIKCVTVCVTEKETSKTIH